MWVSAGCLTWEKSQSSVLSIQPSRCWWNREIRLPAFKPELRLWGSITGNHWDWKYENSHFNLISVGAAFEHNNKAICIKILHRIIPSFSMKEIYFFLSQNEGGDDRENDKEGLRWWEIIPSPGRTRERRTQDICGSKFVIRNRKVSRSLLIIWRTD